MKFFFLKSFLGLTGIFFLIIFLISSYKLVELLYFSDHKIVNKLFSLNSECEASNSIIKNDYCLKIATIYWMIMISTISSILCFITLFPFFNIKRNNKKKNS